MLDTRAIEIATRAQTLIENHLRECSDQNRATIEHMTRLDTKIDKMRDDLNHTINRGMSYVIGILVFSIGYFLVRFGLPGH